MFAGCSMAQFHSTDISSETANGQSKANFMFEKGCKVNLWYLNNTIKHNCKLHEINDHIIVYEYKGSLHDALIKNLLIIELTEAPGTIISFDQEQKPIMLKISSIKKGNRKPKKSQTTFK
jgi:hypothetical protein